MSTRRAARGMSAIANIRLKKTRAPAANRPEESGSARPEVTSSRTAANGTSTKLPIGGSEKPIEASFGGSLYQTMKALVSRSSASKLTTWRSATMWKPSTV